MAGCVLRVSGKAFAPEAFLAPSGLVACKVWHKGERVRNDRIATTSGCNIVVSDADDLLTQVREALAFLHRHQGDFARLANTSEVDALVLDFGVAQRDAAAQFDRFPAELVRAAGELGMSLELSRYAVRNGGSGYDTAV